MSDIMASRAQVIADNQALQQRVIDAEAKIADLQSRPVLAAREKITENPETVAKLAKAQARIADLERQLAAVEDVAPIKAALAKMTLCFDDLQYDFVQEKSNSERNVYELKAVIAAKDKDAITASKEFAKEKSKLLSLIAAKDKDAMMQAKSINEYSEKVKLLNAKISAIIASNKSNSEIDSLNKKLSEANAKVKKLARVQAVIDQVEARNNG